MQNEPRPGLERRAALKAAAGGLLVLKPETAFGTEANSTVEVGIVGCGGRGNWMARVFPEYAGARVVALADVIQGNLETVRTRYKVDASRAYYGPEAFRELVSSRLDAVIIETPPYFHPEHAQAAVDAGKHVYLAKPVAVDVPGCRSILESGRRASGKRSFLVDFQTRAMPAFQEAASRVHRGDIGKPAFGQVYYYAGRPSQNKAQPGMDEGQARVLNFYMDRVLGGDMIVEQNIHAIDVMNWFLNSRPLRACGTGGRTDWAGSIYNAGDSWDHFLVTFWYPGGLTVDYSSNQLTRSFLDVSIRYFGLKGAVDAHYGGLVRITGDNAWLGTEKDDTFRQGAINNVKAFIQSIRDAKPLNNVEEAVESNLTAILGRTAAYKGRVVTWDEMMQWNEKLEASLKLRW